jgi:mycofactocin system FadH/OYE family oxidoreductase 2
MESYENLLRPIKLGNVSIRNRVVFQPHFTSLGVEEGLPTERHAYYYAERAAGGVGLIITEVQAVHKIGKMSPKYIEAYDRKVLDGYRLIADMVHEKGAKIFGQLSHGGETTLEKPPLLLWSASGISEPGCRYVPKVMDRDDIRVVRNSFVVSAKNQLEGGLDGVELKIAHDGILRSFVSPYFNRRNDEYGGSFENRLRLPLEVIEGIREKLGPEVPLGIRLCLDEFTAYGYSFDYGMKLAERLSETGMVTYINSDAGTFDSFEMQIPPMAVPISCFVYMSAELKQITDLPIIAFGRINDPVQAEQILADRQADMIGMARELICEPNFVRKLEEGDVEGIRHCVGCQDGCIYQVMQDKPIRCIQNPAAGREKEYGSATLKKSGRPKKVLVAGGGPAGLKAAEIAAQRGHHVTLFEKDAELGGQVKYIMKLPTREEIGDVTRHLAVRLQSFSVDVELKKEATERVIGALKPDAVIIATGSVARVPYALQGDTVVTVLDILKDEKPVGDRVLVVDHDHRWKGGGIADYLASLGKNVEIVSPMHCIAPDLEPSNNKLLYTRLMEEDVKMRTDHEVTAVDGKRVSIMNVYTREVTEIEGIDTVVFAGDNAPDDALFYKLKPMVKEIYLIGDAQAPRLIEQAIFEGHEIGRKI